MAWNGELTLDEMLRDPIVRLLMQRDGVSEGEVRAVMDGADRERGGRFAGSSPRKDRRAVLPSST